MANVLYKKAKEKFLSGAINLLTSDIKVALVDAADYTYSASHEYFSSVPAGAIVSTSGNLTNKTVTDGVFDADDVTLTTVTGDVSEALVVYKYTGSAATSPLIAYIDTASGLPITPNGGNIVIQWDAGVNKIFAL